MAQVIRFRLDNEEYAFPIEDILEIQNFEGKINVPGTTKYISGIVNIRGRIVVLIDLKIRFNLSKDSVIPKEFIVIDSGEDQVGVLVDQVIGVEKFEESELKKSPKILKTKIPGVFIKGFLVKGKSAIILLDAKKLISAEETVINV